MEASGKGLNKNIYRNLIKPDNSELLRLLYYYYKG